MTTRIVLVHSPLVGSFAWTMVAGVLRRRGWEVAVPTLAQPEAPTEPYWQIHARSAVADLADEPEDTGHVLVGHSGAGPLLPHIGRELNRQVKAYLFVDAGLPRGGVSRMDGPFGDVLRDLYTRGERFPNWTDESLRKILPDATVRARVLGDLRPQPVEFWEEIIPGIDAWPDAPCAYLQFSPAYDDDAGSARSMGWPARHIPAGHFHMLVDPEAAATAILDLLDQLRAGRRSHLQP